MLDQLMKNPGNFKAYLVLKPGVFQVQQQRNFSNLCFNDGQDGQLRHTTSFQPTAWDEGFW